MKLKRSILKIIANYHLHAWKIVLHTGLLIYWGIIMLKKAKKIFFSPHQIGFHLTHPNNSFIMLKTLGPLAIKLFEGRFIEDLIKGKAEPCATGMESSLKFLQNV